MLKSIRLNRRRAMILGAGVVAAGALLPQVGQAQDTIKIGLIAPLTGPFTTTGQMMEAGVKLYMQQHGDTVAGKKIELIVRDDTGVADVTKRIAQEMIANQGVKVLAGFGLTPLALAVAPLSTEAKVPQIVMMAATPVVTTKSPYIIRSAFTTAQSTEPMASWSLKNKIKRVVTIVSDYAPGIDVENTFVKNFKEGGGEIVESHRVPLASRDFTPYLQRAAEAKPDALFVFVPAGIGATLIKQYVERGLDKSGIKLIGEGSVTEDDILSKMDDSVLGMITAHGYSSAHDSAENKAFVAAFKKANDGRRPNLIAVHGYDGMHIIYEALKKTGGKTDGDAILEAAKGMAWTSPRGPVKVDPQSRELLQTMYIRRVERVNGELVNVEFDKVEPK